MRYFIPAILLGLGLTACVNNPPENASPVRVQVATVTKIDTMQQVPVIAQAALPSSDTLVVSEKSAIFISPNDARIEKEKKKSDKDGFYVVANDYLYYMATAQGFLDSMKVTIIDVRNKKVIKLVGNNKKHQLIKVDKVPELWVIYFFDPSKKAKQVDMTMIEEEYEGYFK